jgi:hypothetical protein
VRFVRFAVLALAACSSPAMTSRVSESIAKLDTVSGSFSSLERDPVIAALLAADGEAVEPLIDVLAHDDRTSKVEYDREREFEPVTYAPVHRLAYWILERLIDTSYFVSANAESRMWRDPTARTQVAAELRKEWATWGKQPRSDRWYATLKDDHAKPEEWMAAAKKIFEWVPNRHAWTPYDVADAAPLQGAALRAKHSPTVTEMIETRIGQVEPHDACELVRLLGRWDRGATLRLAAKRMRDEIAGSQTPGTCVWIMTIVRQKLGDDDAVDEYARWIATVPPPTTTSWSDAWFWPMIDNPARPSVTAAAEKLFGPGGSWLPLIPDQPGPGVFGREALVKSRLYLVPAFRRYVAGQLADQHVIGQVLVGNRDWSYRLANGMNLSTSVDAGADGFPIAPGEIPLRVCDFYAYHLADGQRGRPAFELYWDVTRRDLAIAQLLTWLRAQHP